tara:strand:- start:2 stop:667 length:666 start_codon:yes stop_codon:yes gene_type:complete
MLLRKIKNIKNYFSSKEKAKKSPGNIRRDTKSGQLIENVIYEHSLRKILEIGTWNGLGSTNTVIDILEDLNEDYSFISIESDKIFFDQAKKNLKKKMNKNIQLKLGRIIEIDELPDIENINFGEVGLIPQNKEWFIQDLRRYGKVENIYNELPSEFDLVILDGGEFSTYPEFLKLYKKTKFIALDDTETYKQYDVLKFIKNNSGFKLVSETSGFAIYKVSD